MIPEFPEFKSIELGDREEVEKITRRFPPYSDFNFVSMWSWDIKGEMRLSLLNENLVVRFTDYVTGNPFFSFLGDKKVNETTETLLELSKKEGLSTELKLVPEDSIKDLDEQSFKIIEDRDHYDYIFSVSHISNMHDWAQHSSGKNIRNVIKLRKNYTIKNSLMQETKKNECIEIFKKWAKNKGIDASLIANEYNALKRIFDLDSFKDKLNVVSIYIDDILLGFTIYEIASPDYAISHFAKVDKSHDHTLGDLLNWEEAKMLKMRGVQYFNWEQDLGVSGLKISKLKYKPSLFLRKFSIKYKS